MTTPANLRSVAIRVTGVTAALAVSFLAASARAEVVSHRVLHETSPAGSLSRLEVASDAGSRADVSVAINEALSSGGIHGSFAGPRNLAFSGSILTQAAVPTSLLPDHKSGLAHISGLVLRSQR